MANDIENENSGKGPGNGEQSPVLYVKLPNGQTIGVDRFHPHKNYGGEIIEGVKFGSSGNPLRIGQRVETTLIYRGVESSRILTIRGVVKRENGGPEGGDGQQLPGIHILLEEKICGDLPPRILEIPSKAFEEGNHEGLQIRELNLLPPPPFRVGQFVRGIMEGGRPGFFMVSMQGEGGEFYFETTGNKRYSFAYRDGKPYIGKYRVIGIEEGNKGNIWTSPQQEGRARD